jgi:hypothetical protein
MKNWASVTHAWSCNGNKWGLVYIVYVNAALRCTFHKLIFHALLRQHNLRGTTKHFIHGIKVHQSLCRPLTGPEASRRLRLPDFETSAHEGGKIVSPTHKPALPLPQKIFLVLISIMRLSRSSQCHSEVGRTMSMKNFNDTVGERTRNLPAQPTAPPRAPLYTIFRVQFAMNSGGHIVYCTSHMMYLPVSLYRALNQHHLERTILIFKSCN